MRNSVGWGITNGTKRGGWLAVTIRRHKTVTGHTGCSRKYKEFEWSCATRYICHRKVSRAKGVMRWKAEGPARMPFPQPRPLAGDGCQTIKAITGRSKFLFEVNIYIFQWAALVFPRKVLKLCLTKPTLFRFETFFWSRTILGHCSYSLASLALGGRYLLVIVVPLAVHAMAL